MYEYVGRFPNHIQRKGTVMKKFLLLLLALIMVVSVFAACGDGDKGKTESSKKTTPKKDDDTTVEVPENEQLNVDIDSIDYGGNTVVRVIHWQPDNVEFGVTIDESNKNDNVLNAIAMRNSYTDIDLGITLEFNEEAYGYNNVNKFIDELQKWVDDPMTPVDLIAAQTRMMPTILYEGFLTDLNLYSDSLDFDKAWWPESAKDLHEIKGNLYFVSGDISPNLLRMMTLLFVNKTILEAHNYNYESFMEQIRAGEWYLDDLMEMTQGMWKNGDDTTQPGPSVDDEFGLVTAWMHSDALYVGCGFKYLVTSSKDDQVFRLSSDMTGELVGNYVTDMIDWAKTYDFYCGPVGSGLYQDNFKDGKSLFCLHRAWYGFTLQETDINFAIIPTPKLNEDQDEYYTTIGNQYTSYGICTDSEDYDRAAQTMQVLGYYGFTYTTPEIFEVSFKGQQAKDDYAILMFDIVRNAISFDPGRIYDSFIAGSDGSMWKYYPPNIISFAICATEEDKSVWTTDNVWTSSFSNSKRKYLTDTLIAQANEKLLQYANN